MGGSTAVLLYLAAENRLAALSAVLRAFFARIGFFARGELVLKRVSGVELSGKPIKLCPWRCPQPRAAKVTAGVAVAGKMASITRATAVV